MRRMVMAALCSSILISLMAAVSQASSPFDPTAQREIRVSMKKFEFSPKQITVRKGERIKLIVKSEDVDHGIAVEELGIDQAVKAGQTKTVEFTATREGKFRMYCSVFCGDGHPEMEGEIIVTGGGEDLSAMQVKFEQSEPDVVYVSSGRETLRINTRTREVVKVEERLASSETTPAAVPAQESESASVSPPQPYDYQVVNVPTPKRVPRGSLNILFTHRFRQPIRPLEDSDDDLFGLDSSSISSIGLTYGITDRLYARFYRSPIAQQGLFKTIELGFGYHLLDEAGRSPIALSAYASVEGDNNFKEDFTYNLQAMMSRSVTRYVTLFFSPAVHINSNKDRRFLRDFEDSFSEDVINNINDFGEHGASFGLGVNARIRPTLSLLFEYVPRTGFKLGTFNATVDEETGEVIRLENVSEASLGFGIEKRLGRHSFSLTFSNTQATTTSRYNSSNLGRPADRFSIGFNLFRRLL
ncbi:MAG TPA: DUF5777 family beta-barrel protein [Blastocatellia bacterium]